jgi:hypothetical protein
VTTHFTEPDLMAIRAVTPHTPNGSEECLELSTPWVHLWLCMTCGHVGGCDSSPMRHARSHAHTGGHPIMQIHGDRRILALALCPQELCLSLAVAAA